MRLCASGLTREQAQRLAEIVAQRLAKLPLVTNESRKIPSLNMRVHSSAGRSIERTADEIAFGIRRSLRSGVE
jgi:hypothetical protein